MPFETRTFKHGGKHYAVVEAPMSLLLPLIEKNQHDLILRRVMEERTYRVEPDQEEVPAGAEPLGEAVYDEFGMKGYTALAKLVMELNGLEDQEKEGEEGEAQAEGNSET